VVRAALPVALLLALPVPARADEPSLSLLLKRTLDAYGGQGALARYPAVRQEGAVTSTLRQGSAGKLTRLFERPRRLRVETAFRGEEPEVRLLDRGRCWRSGVEVSGTGRYQAMVLQAARLDLPLILVEGRMKLVDGGTVRHGRQKLRVVTLPLAQGLSLTAEIDPATGRILRSTGRMEIGPAGPMDFVTTYDDFRRVDGVLVPFREDSFAGGQKTEETVLEKVEFLRRPPDQGWRP
jgi:hypothetical protein